MVGTENPKPEPQPKIISAKFISDLCEVIDRCGPPRSDCKFQMAENSDLGGAFQLNLQRHPNLAIVSQSLEAGEVRIDPVSASECVKHLSTQPCDGPTGNVFFDGGSLSAEKVKEVVRQSAACGRAVVDHLNFEMKESSRPSGTFSSVARVQRIGDQAILLLLSDKALSAYGFNTSAEAQHIKTTQLGDSGARLLWTERSGKPYACVVLATKAQIDCHSFPELPPSPSFSFDLVPEFGFGTIADAEFLRLGVGPEETLVAISFSAEFAISVGSDGLRKRHSFPVGYRYPRSIVIPENRNDFGAIFFPGKGLFEFRSNLGGQFVDQDLVSLPEVGDVVVSKETSGKKGLYALFPSEKVIRSYDLIGTALTRLSESRLPLVPERLGVYRLSESTKGVVFSSALGMRLTFLIEAETGRFTLPVSVELASPTLGFSVLDLDGDSHDDIYTDSQQSELLRILRKR